MNCHLGAGGKVISQRQFCQRYMSISDKVLLNKPHYGGNPHINEGRQRWHICSLSALGCERQGAMTLLGMLTWLWNWRNCNFLINLEKTALTVMINLSNRPEISISLCKTISEHYTVHKHAFNLESFTLQTNIARIVVNSLFSAKIRQSINVCVTKQRTDWIPVWNWICEWSAATAISPYHSVIAPNWVFHLPHLIHGEKPDTL